MVYRMKEKRVTKAEVKAFVRNKLGTSQAWMLKGLIAIYNLQTVEEQSSGQTNEDNGVGFTGCDAEILSSFAEQYLQRGRLSPKQMEIIRKKMPRYWAQIISISNNDKLIAQVQKAMDECVTY